jgi:hypothetical protein
MAGPVAADCRPWPVSGRGQSPVGRFGSSRGVGGAIIVLSAWGARLVDRLAAHGQSVPAGLIYVLGAIAVVTLIMLNVTQISEHDHRHATDDRRLALLGLVHRAARLRSSCTAAPRARARSRSRGRGSPGSSSTTRPPASSGCRSASSSVSRGCRAAWASWATRPGPMAARRCAATGRTPSRSPSRAARRSPTSGTATS